MHGSMSGGIRMLLLHGGAANPSPAAEFLQGETDGLALSFTDTFFLNSTGHYGSARVKDTSTPANNYNSHPFGLLTYAGASKKWVRGPSGLLIESDPALTLPYEWDTNGNLLGIVRPEPQRTNLLLWSADFTKTVNWGGSSTFDSVENVSSFISGLETAQRHVDDGSGFNNRAQSVTLEESTDYVVSVVIENETADVVDIGLRDVPEAGWIALVRFTWATDSFSTVTGTVSDTFLEELGTGPNGGRLVRISFVTNSGEVTDSRVFIYPCGQAENTNSAILHGCQLEPGTFPSSFIVTADSTVTRAADAIGPALDKFSWNEGNGVLTVNDEEVEPSDDGTILTLAAPDGHTHIKTVKWIPSS